MIMLVNMIKTTFKKNMDEVTGSHNPVLYWLCPHLDQNGPPITGFKNRGPAHPLDPCSTSNGVDLLLSIHIQYSLKIICPKHGSICHMHIIVYILNIVLYMYVYVYDMNTP